MAQRLSKTQKAIYEAHKAAFLSKEWTMPAVGSHREHRQLLREGKTSEGLWEVITEEYESMTGTLVGNTFGHLSEKYLAGMRKGFLSYLSDVGIV